MKTNVKRISIASLDGTELPPEIREAVSAVADELRDSMDKIVATIPDTRIGRRSAYLAKTLFTLAQVFRLIDCPEKLKHAITGETTDLVGMIRDIDTELVMAKVDEMMKVSAKADEKISAILAAAAKVAEAALAKAATKGEQS